MNDKDELAVRKVRADAERNRVRLLEAAKAAFADKGSAASLEEIARDAGVGIGTLYRHFPTRDALNPRRQCIDSYMCRDNTQSHHLMTLLESVNESK